jgi:hypothetical protein
MNGIITVNPLLDLSGLPRFHDIRPEHVEQALDQVLADSRARIAELEQQVEQADWDKAPSCARPTRPACPSWPPTRPNWGKTKFLITVIEASPTAPLLLRWNRPSRRSSTMRCAIFALPA